MIGFAVQTVGTAIALWLTALIYPQINFGPNASIGGVLVVAIVVGLANALIKPILKILSFPLSLMTLGLSALVVNAVLLLAVAWATRELKVAFEVGGFPDKGFSVDAIVAAVVGAVILSVVSLVIGRLPFLKTSR